MQSPSSSVVIITTTIVASKVSAYSSNDTSTELHGSEPTDHLAESLERHLAILDHDVVQRLEPALGGTDGIRTEGSHELLPRHGILGTRHLMPKVLRDSHVSHVVHRSMCRQDTSYSGDNIVGGIKDLGTVLDLLALGDDELQLDQQLVERRPDARCHGPARFQQGADAVQATSIESAEVSAGLRATRWHTHRSGVSAGMGGRALRRIAARS